MRVLTRYLARDYLSVFLLTVSVFTFVMTLGSFVQAIDLMARGISGGLVFRFVLLNIPYVLQFTVPMATLTTSLLLFTRLSLDGEITAMKACGISLWAILRPVLAVSLGLSAASLWLSGDLSPRSRYAQRLLAARVGDGDPLALLEEGTFTRDFPGHLIYVGSRDGDRVEDLVVYKLDDRGVSATIRARHGRVEVLPAEQVLKADLYQARIEQVDPHDRTLVRSFTAEHYPERIDLSALFRTGSVSKKRSYHTTRELNESLRAMDRMDLPGPPAPEWVRERLEILVELGVRRALSLGCFGFTLLGIPLGIHSRRKESSLGVLVSLGIIFLFYFVMILARSMTGHPGWMPDLLIWIPLLLAEAVGLLLIRRAN